MLTKLPIGQRRVAEALLSKDVGRTYPEVAALLRINLGTVHTHLRRIRLQHPAIYRALMAERARQLAARHRRATAKEKERAKQWFKMRYRCPFDGCGFRS
jgi:DNA-binding CsgD family transcriptional regulator